MNDTIIEVTKKGLKIFDYNKIFSIFDAIDFFPWKFHWTVFSHSLMANQC